MTADDVPIHGVAPQAKIMAYGVCMNVLSIAGSLLAVMDSVEVTIQRTAAATAVAAERMARRDASVITICA